MSFIQENDKKIRFSSQLDQFGAQCNVLSSESSGLVLTEAGILLQQDCDEAFKACEGSCVRENASGAFTITNTCSVPITITGLVVHDPEMFGLFDEGYTSLSEYSKEWSADYMPFTIQPNKSHTIKTFFNPGASQLKQSKRYTLEDNEGAPKFGTKVDIYPGFPVLKEGAETDSCDTSITLTGEFLCPINKPEKMDWAYNRSQFSQPLDYLNKRVSMSVFKNRDFLNRTEVFDVQYSERVSEDNWNNGYGIISKAIYDYASHLDSNNWFEGISSNWGITGAIDLVYSMVNDSLNKGRDVYSSDYSKDFSLTSVDKVSSSFFNKNLAHPKSVSVPGRSDIYMGFLVDTEPVDLPVGYIKDQALYVSVSSLGNNLNNASSSIANKSRGSFIKTLLNTKSRSTINVSIFMADHGDLENSTISILK
jgi:hypothetical protein